MKISWNWLSEFLPPDHGITPRQACDILTAQGLEVEEVQEIGDIDAKVVVAKVLEKRPHPGADRLSLCRVTTGEREFKVVCGAKNVEAGGVYPFAQIGATLPAGMTLKPCKIRGEESEGMLCSEAELALPQSSVGARVAPSSRSEFDLSLPLSRPVAANMPGLLELPIESPLGLAVCDLPGIHDHVLEINVTPNRGDCLSHVGIARELYAHFLDWDLSCLGRLFTASPIKASAWQPIDVDLSGDGVPFYLGRALRGVRVEAVPFAVRRRLLACGIRPMNAVVDATNAVMLELGHPVHAFDLKRLRGKRVSVRRAEDGETIVTLDEEKRSLERGDLVVCDEGGPIALAGVMGGLDSRVRDDTDALFLECAVFDPVSIRRTGKRLGLASESSYRFERGVDASAAPLVMERLSALIRDWGGAEAFEAGRGVSAGKAGLASHSISFSWSRAERLLGMPLDRPATRAAFERLGFGLEDDDKGDVVAVSVPAHRPDVEGAADLAEEAARIGGYVRLASRLPLLPARVNPLSRLYHALADLRVFLVAHGFSETIHLSFMPIGGARGPAGADPSPLMLQNPLSEREAGLRQSIALQLVSDYARNERMSGCASRLFETGTVFRSLERGDEETAHLGLLMDTQDVDFFVFKGLVESLLEQVSFPLRAVRSQGIQSPAWRALFHPGKSAAFTVQREFAWFGELHPLEAKQLKLKQAPWLLELDLRFILEAGGKSRNERQYTPLSFFPGTTRDLSLVVDAGVPYGDFEDFFVGERRSTPLLQGVALVSVYEGGSLPAGKKSLSFRLSYASPERTLTDDEVNAIYFKLIDKVKDQKKVEIR